MMKLLYAALLGAPLAALSAHSALAQADPKGPDAPAQVRPADGPLAGRPETAGAQRLAPATPPPLTTAAADLPLGKIQVPDGFKVEVFASGINNARTLRVSDAGTVFVGNWQGNNVWAIPKGGEPRMIYQGLDWPNGLALHGGDLYIAEHHRIAKAADIENNLDNPPELEEIYADLGEPRPHGWRFLAVSPDEKLYVSNSAPCNICALEEGFGEVRAMNLDGSDAKAVLRGMRNTVGFDFHPATGDLYFTDNQRDWLSEDLPEDELNRMSDIGSQHFGFPFCHNGTFTDPEFGWGYSCDDFTDPVALLGPHTAPLGMRFYNGDMFPDDYKGQIFIARHGPWNRSEKIGGDVVVAHLDDNGDVTEIQPFLTGLIENNEYIGRPVDVEVMPDGSLLVSDDWNGAVYRVSYGG
ncbi:PQQ-dependent sugar dehydrogenase [Acuticoccus sp. MNP-M23]|uniref:PQQ-dependent sugar dehydrogenase n=1 Tax=Acuticoccus sp. MNP-M23 TaxID=3072793 RepID=UPI002815CE86|nr:PQQ-dependent sugar dehydrogenase [Acuticoccus sp. MNP-M23]WMS41456.1 PQQ-dependent sugar dehydrogenase [Acuticoccus sp. MNP-M23]